MLTPCWGSPAGTFIGFAAAPSAIDPATFPSIASRRCIRPSQREFQTVIPPPSIRCSAYGINLCLHGTRLDRFTVKRQLPANFTRQQPYRYAVPEVHRLPAVAQLWVAMSSPLGIAELGWMLLALVAHGANVVPAGPDGWTVSPRPT